MSGLINLARVSGFDWDKANLLHIGKHKVTETECEEAFFNKPLLVNDDTTHSQDEQRFHALGKSNTGRCLFVAFTLRKNRIRVISSRDQSRKERKEYADLGGD